MKNKFFEFGIDSIKINNGYITFPLTHKFLDFIKNIKLNNTYFNYTDINI